MREQFVDRFCASLKETERTTPFGSDTVIWTIRGHMFAAYTVGGEGISVRVSSKLLARKLSGEGRAISNPYLRGGEWVLFPWNTSPDELRARIHSSFDLVAADGNMV